MSVKYTALAIRSNTGLPSFSISRRNHVPVRLKMILLTTLIGIVGFSANLFGQCTPNNITAVDDTICVGGNKQVTANNVPGTQTYLWQVNINGGGWVDAAGTNNNQNYGMPNTYENTPGVYVFRRIVTDDNPAVCADTSGTVTITVVPDISAVVIVVDNATVCVGGSATLSLDDVTGGSGYWQYDWEQSSNGTSGWSNASPGPQNEETYAAPTTTPGTTFYRLRLNDTDTGCNDNNFSNVLSVTRVDDPVAPVIEKVPADMTVCAGQSLTISVTTPGGGGTGNCTDEYRYSTDNGANWSAWNTTIPVFAAGSPGPSLVQSRRICDASGCESTYNEVSWTTNPGPTCSINGPISVCTNTSGHMYDGPGGMASYAWDISGNGSIVSATDGQTVSVDAGAPGTYTLTLSITDDNGCTSVCTLEVTVNSLPGVYTLSGIGTSCDGILLTLDNSETGVNYELYLNAVATGVILPGTGFPLPFALQTTAGTYTAVAVNGSTGCSATMNGAPVLAGTSELVLSANGPASAECDENIMVTVETTSGFCNMSSLQFSMAWNPAQYVYVSHTESGLADPTINVNNDGLLFSWADATGCPSLDDGTVILTIEFQVLGCDVEGANVIITSDPLTILAEDCGLNTVPVTVQNNVMVDIQDTTPPTADCPPSPANPTEWPVGFNTDPVGLNIPQDPSIDPFNPLGGPGVPTNLADNCTPAGSIIMDFQDEIEFLGPCDASGDVVWRVTRTWILTDECMNSTAACVQTFEYFDTTPPTADCPTAVFPPQEWPAGFNTDPVMANTPQDPSIDPAETGMPTNLADNCTPPGSIQVDYQDEITFLGPCNTPGQILWRVTRTWTIADDCGNSINCTQTFEYFDTTAPTADCPASPADPIEWPAGFNTDPVDPNTPQDPSIAPGVTGMPQNVQDNCTPPGSIQVTYQDNIVFVGPCNTPGQVVWRVTRVWRIEDDCGNFTICTQQFEFIDTTPPTADCPESPADPIEWPEVFNITSVPPNIPQDPSLDPVITGIPENVQDNCTPTPLIQVGFQDEIEFLGPCTMSGQVVWRVTRTWTMIDECGNVGECVQVFEYVDTTPPTADCPPSPADPIEWPEGFNTSAVGPNTPQDPSLEPVLPTGGGTGVPMNLADNCTPANQIQVNYQDEIEFLGPCDASGDVVWRVTRTWTISDDCGNVTECVQIFEYVDTTPPTADCPPTQTAPQEWPADFNIDPVGANTPQDPSLDPAITGEPNNLADNCTPSNLIEVNYQDVLEFLGPCDAPGQVVWRVTRTWTIADDCGNETTCVQVFLFIDTTPPTIVCPPGLTASCSVDEQQPYADFSEFENAGGSASDNCALDPASFQYAGEVSDNGDCPEIVTRFYRISDDCGNVGECTQIITVNDEINPTLNCPPEILNICELDDAPPYQNYNAFETAGGSSDDNCEIDEGSFAFVEDNTDEGNCPEIVTRTYVIADLCGNTALCDQTITINDLEDPELTCPPDLTAICSISEQAPYGSYDEFVADGGTSNDNCGIDPTTFTMSGVVSDNGSCPETVTRTYYIEDNCGNFAICTQKVVIDDNIEPTLICPDGLTADCDISEQPAYINYNAFETAGGSSDDNCGIDEGSFELLSEVSDNGFCPEVITRTYQIADLCGNTAICSQRVIVDDDELPELTCPPALTAVCDVDELPDYADWTEFMNAGGSGDDNCGLNTSTFTLLSENSDGNSCPEVVTRTYQIEDLCGNTGTCAQIITVDDEEIPELICPSDLSAECDLTEQPAYTTWTEFMNAGGSGNDNCGLNTSTLTLLSEISDGSFCPEVVTRTYQIEDLCGNTGTCAQTVTIDDDQLPTFICPPDFTVDCAISQAPEYPSLSLFIAAGGQASDNCGIDEFSFVLLSEVSDNGFCPETITRTYQVADLCGNLNTCAQIVTVHDEKLPELTCPDDLLASCDISEQPAYANFNEFEAAGGSADDNCGVDEASFALLSEVSDNGFCPEVITRTYQIADLCGNLTTCVQIVTVDDDELPEINCPPALTAECDVDEQPAYSSWTEFTDAGGTGDDNCGLNTASFVLLSENSDGNSCPEVVTRIYQIADLCGNTEICTQIITIDDEEIPELVCPSDLTAVCDVDEQPAYTDWTAFTNAGGSGDDNCGLNTSTFTLLSENSDGNTCPEIVTRTYQIEDLCGNTGTCAQTITVEDEILPTLVCPDDLTVDCDIDQVTAYQTLSQFVGAGGQASDNCGIDELSFVLLSEVSDNGDCPETVTRTYGIADLCGNTATCEQDIEINDEEVPVLICPPALAASCDISEQPAYADWTEFTDAGGSGDDNCGLDTDTFVLLSEESDGNDCPEIFTRTYQVEDLCGNTGTCEQRIAVHDLVNPEITCPPSVTIECDESLDPNVNSNLGVATASDNCGMVEIDSSDVVLPGNCPDDRIVIRTWIATDACGNQAECSQAITVDDSTPPVITCPADQTVDCLDPVDPAATGIATAMDNCDSAPNVGHVDEIETGDCPQERTITRTWSAFDNCGNSTSCVQTIFVDDSTPPVIQGPPVVTVECNESLDPAQNPDLGEATATDDCSTFEITYSDAPITGSCPQAAIIVRTWTATDACGNSASTQQIITVEDSTPPDLVCPADTVINCEVDPIPANTGMATATDNCDMGPLTITSSDVEETGGCPQERKITRTWETEDACGNATSCMQVITVQDTTRPALICPVNMTVDCSEDPEPALTGTPTATDNCDDGPFIFDYTDSVTPGNCPQERTLVRTWTTTDACGNTGTCEQTITVDDSTAPVISCPPDTSVECDEDSSPDNTGTATATDDCDPAPVITFSDEETPGNCPQEKTITRTWTATDACGNATSCTQVIIVDDTTPPTIEGGCDLLTQFGNGISKASYVVATSGGSDCPADATVLLTVGQDVSENDVIEVAGVEVPGLLGCLADNCTPTEDLIARVVAINESGDDCQKFFEIRFVVLDACENESLDTISYQIEVLDDTDPTFTVPDDVTINCEDDRDDLNITGDVTDEEDNCQDDLEATYVDNLDGLDGCNGTGLIERTWTLDDGCGNSLVQVQMIRVIDETAPILTCPADTVINCEVDPIPANTGMATATDNCTSAVDISFMDQTQPGNCPDRRLITRTWTAMDDCGNSISCTQIIEVQDTTKPVIMCPPNITLDCEVDPDPSAAGTATATDNCDLALAITFLDTNTPGDCAFEQKINRRWVAVDNCLNAAACVQMITVQDITPPDITCAPNVTVECDEDTSPASTGEPTVVDACDPNPVVEFEDFETPLGACPQNYLIIRTWTATDACGNSWICVQEIVVEDTTAPSIECPDDVTVECDVDLTPGAGLPTGAPIVTDNCDPAPGVTHVDDSELGGCPQEQTITRLWAAVDACGNPVACEQIITVEDTTPPVLECPPNSTVNCDEDPAPALTGEPTATDNCDSGPFTFEFTDDVTPGNCPQERMLVRTWTTTDACGNEGTCEQTVTVDDSTAPEITCPADLTVACDEDFSPSATGMATATDDCDPEPGIDFSDLATPGACPQERTITRTWFAVDACGNNSSCDQTIEVVDDEAPTFDPGCQLDPLMLLTSADADCPSEAGINLTTGQTISSDDTWFVAGTEVVSLSGCVFDNCADEEEIIITVASIEVNDDNLPCERTITVSFELSDPCGNVNTELFTNIYAIKDDVAPSFTVPGDLTISCEQDKDDLGLTGDVTDEDDDCQIDLEATYSDDLSGLDGCNGTGVIERTWTLDDGCGNSTEQTQLIRVIDETAPEMNCPVDITIACGDDTSPANTGEPGVFDNCDMDLTPGFEDTVFPGTCPVTQIISRQWTVEDDCGNSTNCIQRITIEDTTPPVIDCPGDITIACDDDTSPASTGMATATDECDPTPTITFTDEVEPGSCPQERIIVRTWFAFDSCGNVDACDQFITLIDEVSPEITCPADTVINCEVDPIPANTGMATATDNCDPQPVITFTDEFETDPDCPQARKISRTWLVEDGCGNTADCIQVISVQDTTRPSIVCPANVTIECDESVDPAVNSNVGMASVQDNCDADPVITFSDMTTTGSCPQERTIKRTWLAADHCDNAAICMQTITVDDSTPPLVECPADTVVNCDSGTLPTDLGEATATDNCGMATVPTFTEEVIPGNCPQESAIVRTWTSEDECGNVGSCIQTIAVQDTTLPKFTVPADTTIYADTNCEYDADPAVTGDVTDEDDNCATGIEAEYSDEIEDGDCVGMKIITRTWRLNDGCDNILTQNQIITVLDTLNPTFPKPADMTLTTSNGANCPGTAEISLTVDQTNPVATGNTAFVYTVHGIEIDGPTVYSDNCSSGDNLQLFVWNVFEDWDGPADDCQRKIRVLWRVYDDCGNFRQRQQIFTILDDTPPTFTVPDDVTISCEEDANDLNLTGDVTDEDDNCQDGLEATYTDDISGLDGCDGSGVIVRTWTLDDGCGNSTEQVQMIHVIDETIPEITCPADTVINCEVEPIPANTGMAAVSDNCDADPAVSFEDISTQGQCPEEKIIRRIWTVEDECGNSTSCIQQIMVQDTTRPVITCPPAVTISCEESLDPALNMNLDSAMVVDNCDIEPGLTYTDVSLPGDCPQGKAIVRTWLAVDNCSNPAACTQKITVVDETPPAITCPADATVNCDGDFSTDALGKAEAVDNCDPNPIVTFTEESTVGDCPQEKTILRTWAAEDACGNSTICIQTITVQDTTRPVIVCPPTATVQCNESTDPAVNPNVGVATATDNCDDELVIDYIDTDLGVNGCTRTILRNWIAADDCNNAAACSQLIIITDTEAPVLTCPDDQTVECGEDTSPDALGYATVEDDCGAATTPTFTDETIAGNCDQEYTIIRTWTSEDDCGNTGSCTQTITVDDSTAPEITCPADMTINCGDELDPAVNTALGVATATDNCDAAPVVTYEDATETGACPTGVIIVRTWTATDACGNSTICVQRIGLVDNSPPSIDCPADITVDCGEELDPFINANLGVAVAVDDCAAQTIVTYADVSVPGTCPEIQTITRTWTVVDPCDNTTLCVQIIVVQDTTAPKIECPDDLTFEWADGFNIEQVPANTPQDPSVDPVGLPGGPPGTGLPDVSDNCDDPEVTFQDVLKGPNPDNCPELWVLERTWTVKDACGLTATCLQTITFTDTTPPTMDCPGDMTLEWPAGFNTQQVPPNQPQDPSVNPGVTGLPDVSDNCGTPQVEFRDVLIGPNPNNCPELWVLERTWLATDACGLTAICTQKITFTDTTPPQLDCPADTVINCEVDPIPAITGEATATDNCGIPTIDYTDDVDQGSCPQEKVIKRTWIAVDDCGNSAVCAQFITVQDTTPPSFTAPADITLYADTVCQVNATNLGDVTDESDNCSVDLEAMFVDSVEAGPGGTERTIYRIWTLSDDCGNTNEQIQVIAIRDTIPPMFECAADSIVSPNTDTCTYAVPGLEYDPKMLKDNCGIDTLTYTLSGATTGSGGNTLQGAVLNVGNTIVEWTLTDVNGNSVTCTLLIRVNQCAGITGTVIWEGNDADTVGVAQVTVDMTGDDTGAVGPTPASGDYSIIPSTGSNFVLTPSKPGLLTTIPIDPLNGVTGDDALIIRLHLYGLLLITDPYKLIAADVDMDNVITFNDEVQIRRALLGSEPALELFRNMPWRFVPDTTDTPWSLGYHPPANPFSAPIPSSRMLTGASGGASDQNFYGIKKGDVNSTANPLLHPVPVDPLIFRVQDENLVAGKEISVVFRASNFNNLMLFQEALFANPNYLELLEVQTVGSPVGLSVDEHFGLSLAEEGEIRTLWLNSSGQTLDDNTALFTLRFKVLQGGRKLSDVLRLKPKSLEPMAYTADHARAGLELVFSETTATQDPTEVAKQIELLQNRPNPFWHSTIIGFVLPEACTAQLRIMDVTGRELYRIDNTYPAGYNEETILLRDIGSVGILYYELTTPYGKQTRKMKAVSP